MKRKSKEEYKIANERFLAQTAHEPGFMPLAKGILYKVLATGNGRQATPSSVVSVYYKGRLADGRVFDDNSSDRVPAAFRLRDLIVGWQIAIRNMREGDKWRVVIPPAYGYGSRSVPGIPGNSVLIFDITLVKVN